MAYTPTVWEDGDVITAAKLNKNENRTIESADITDATATGRNLITAATQAAARTAIGAGTSSLALGTTASTAKAGNYAPAWDEVTGKPAVIAAGADAAAARTAIGAGTPYTLPAATTAANGGVKKMPAQADSTATDAEGLVTDFNALLAKLRTAGILTT